MEFIFADIQEKRIKSFIYGVNKPGTQLFQIYLSDMIQGGPLNQCYPVSNANLAANFLEAFMNEAFLVTYFQQIQNALQTQIERS